MKLLVTSGYRSSSIESGCVNVSVSDRIGLFPFAGWMAGHGFLMTLALCWLVTPGMMFILAAVGESRWLPVSSKRQFESFFPGDLFLGIMTTILLRLSRFLPVEHRWYNGGVWHFTVLLAALMVALVLTFVADWHSELYEKRAILSPTKLYHNFVLYGGYGYLVFATLMAILFGSPWGIALILGLVFGVLLPGGYWLILLRKDNKDGIEGQQVKARHAHTPYWVPIWQGWHLLFPRR